MKWPCWVHALPKEFDSLSATPRTRFLIPGLDQENRVPHVRLWHQVIVDSRRKLPMCLFNSKGCFQRWSSMTVSSVSLHWLPVASSALIVYPKRALYVSSSPSLLGLSPTTDWLEPTFSRSCARVKDPIVYGMFSHSSSSPCASIHLILTPLTYDNISIYLFFRKCSIAPSTGKKPTVSLVPFFKPYTLYRLTFGPWQTGSALFTFIFEIQWFFKSTKVKNCIVLVAVTA